MNAASASAQAARDFTITSADGVVVTGQADLPARLPHAAVIMVAGTGPFDRDVNFAAPGAPASLVFADLSRRLTARGLAVVRYDKRGVRYGSPAGERVDRALAAGVTTTTMRDDLAAVYNWTRDADGFSQRCVVLFGHSEGMAHIGRLADSGAPAPAAVVGMGAMLESPATGFRWRFAERDAHSLRLMDRDGDGRTTNDEVNANLERTPAWVNGMREPYLHPAGAWTEADIERLTAAQAQAYEQFRAAILAMEDDAPWPSADAVQASYQWWKSWLSDDTHIAQRLARWDAPMVFHYGSVDSQTNYERERGVGESELGDRARFVLHDNVGHTLGSHVAFGPIDEAIAEQLADDIAAAAAACS